MKSDILIIGGGAAGMLAAISAARAGVSVTLLERNDVLGRKLLITGKGRCNLTNNCSVQEVLQNVPRNPRFLYSAMTAFPPASTMALFEELGCPVKTERGNRVFPQSDDAHSVRDALRRELARKHVSVCKGRVLALLTDGGRVCGVRTQDAVYSAKAVILASGGVSYPATGSTGDGYALARSVGHTVTAQEGSLVPLECAGDECRAMQGLSLRNVGVQLTDARGKLLYRDFGELLFTHFGLSGPTVLSASCHLTKPGCRFTIDLKPALDESKLDTRVLRDLEENRNRSMENALTGLLPRAMIPIVLNRLNISPDEQANSFTRVQRRELVTLLKHFSFEITGKRPVSEAIITSGGVKTSEIDPKTMASKLAPGLYFAGEIIDCDAYTGGFNLQIAWATGYCAGRAAAQYARVCEESVN